MWHLGSVPIPIWQSAQWSGSAFSHPRNSANTFRTCSESNTEWQVTCESHVISLSFNWLSCCLFHPVCLCHHCPPWQPCWSSGLDVHGLMRCFQPWLLPDVALNSLTTATIVYTWEFTSARAPTMPLLSTTQRAPLFGVTTSNNTLPCPQFIDHHAC